MIVWPSLTFCSPLSSFPSVCFLSESSDRCIAAGLVYAAQSALLHCGLSQLVPFTPQRNLKNSPVGPRSHPEWAPLFIQPHTVTNDWFMQCYAVTLFAVCRESSQTNTRWWHCDCGGVRVRQEGGVNPEVAQHCHANKNWFEFELNWVVLWDQRMKSVPNQLEDKWHTDII